MNTINIKPLSVNQAWKGQRIKTDAYRKFQRDVLLMLPKIPIGIPPFKIKLQFGFSNKLADLDNPVKIFQDCLVKKYGFDDRDVYRLDIEKFIVPKGEEYIKFEITEK